jgi:chromosomal replication initiation ATPase DnaA
MKGKMISAQVIPGLGTPDDIATEIWSLEENQIFAKIRKREVVEARMTVMWYRHDKLGMTLSKAAEPYGKDHATVVYAGRQIEALLHSDMAFRAKHEVFCQRVR